MTKLISRSVLFVAVMAALVCSPNNGFASMEDAVETCDTPKAAYLETITRPGSFSEVVVSYFSRQKVAVVGPSKLHGLGLFAQEDLAVGDMVSLKGVEVLTNDAGIKPEWRFFEPKVEGSESEPLKLKSDLTEADLQQLCRFYHKSALELTNVRAVAGFNGLVGLEVIKPIKNGEELLRGYMFGHWLREWTVGHIEREREVPFVLWNYIKAHQPEAIRNIVALSSLSAFLAAASKDSEGDGAGSSGSSEEL